MCLEIAIGLLYCRVVSFHTPEFIDFRHFLIEVYGFGPGLWDHSGFYPTSVILLWISPVMWWDSLWDALIVVSQKWVPFPTALFVTFGLKCTPCTQYPAFLQLVSTKKGIGIYLGKPFSVFQPKNTH